MSNKVIVVVVDGMRYDMACENLGYIEHLVEKKKAARYKVQSELPSLSRPLYEVLLTGTPSSINGITANEVVRKSKQTSIFHLTQANGLRNAAAAYYWVSELYNRAPFNYIEDREQQNTEAPIQYGRFYFDDAYPDSHLLIDGEQLRRKHDPDFLYIHPMGIDDTGHKYGSDSREYRGKIGRMDNQLSQLVPEWIEKGYHVIITSDHGMNEYGLHGGTTDGERHVPLYLVSPRVAPDIYEEAVPQLAVAPLICQLLQINPSKEMINYKWAGMD